MTEPKPKLPKVFIGILAGKKHDRFATLFNKHLDEAIKAYVQIGGVVGKAVCKENIGDTMIDRIVNGRNILRDAFLQTDCDLYFSVDSDVLLPKMSIVSLVGDCMADGCDIVSGIYFGMLKYENEKGVKRAIEFCPVMFFKIDDKKQKPHMRNCRGSFNLHEYFPSRVFQIHSCGAGFVMIKRKVLETIKWRHTHTKKLAIGEDISLCVDAQKKGMKVWCDSYLWALHLKDDKALKENRKEVVEFNLEKKKK